MRACGFLLIFLSPCCATAHFRHPHDGMFLCLHGFHLPVFSFPFRYPLYVEEIRRRIFLRIIFRLVEMTSEKAETQEDSRAG